MLLKFVLFCTFCLISQFLWPSCDAYYLKSNNKATTSRTQIILSNELNKLNDNLYEMIVTLKQLLILTGDNGNFENEDVPAAKKKSIIPLAYFFGNSGRCLNLGDDGCVNGNLPGSGKDDDFLGGGGTPGKRSF